MSEGQNRALVLLLTHHSSLLTKITSSVPSYQLPVRSLFDQALITDG